jgi:hypothetical protein
MPTMQPDTSAELASPFAGLYSTGPAEEADRAATELESPFGAGFAVEPGERANGLAAEFLDQLSDEDFADAVEALVDDAAAQHLADQGSFTARPSTAESRLALEAWIEPLASASERAVDQIADRLAAVDPLAMSAHELDELLDSVAPEHLGIEGFEQFLGGLLRKARKLVGGAVDLAKKGLAAAGKVLPIGALLGRLKALVRPLLNRVLRAALNRLPASVRPIARVLAAKLGLGEAERLEGDLVTRLAEDFDLEVAGLLYADTGAKRPETELEGEGEEEGEAGDAREGSIGELDAARERLAAQLTELPPGIPPVAELEQFIPAVLAVRPLIKLGISLVGRARIVRFLAERIAGLIKGMVGVEAAGMVSRPLVDVGLRMLGFEMPAGEEHVLAGEALASTVEGTVLRLLELPAETIGDELQLDAAVQQAFAEAAAAAMPDRLLRADLPERETAREDGVWVLMPRAARPAYRYRRYARAFVVPVSRQLARVVPWSDGGTLESYLLDGGAEHWPVQSEVELYEALPGTHLGHLAADPGEVQALTPEIAGLLLGEPGLGRRVPPTLPGRFGARPAPGLRFYRIRPAGSPGRRRRRAWRRLLVALDLTSARPSLQVTLRLSERQGQQALARLDAPARDLAGTLTELRKHYADALPAALVGRLLRRSLVPDAARARAVADKVTAGVTAALSAFLTERAAQLAAAVRDPANGVTITVTFPGVTRAGLDSALPTAQVAVEPGWRRRG